MTHLFTRLRARLIPHAPQALSSLEAYARWAATYPPRAHNVLMRTEEAAMKCLLPPLAGQTVLDLAYVTGRYGPIAQVQGTQLALGIDNILAMLRANVMTGRALATTEALPLPANSIDIIVCGLALGHLPQLKPSFDEMRRILKPGGWAL